MPDRQGGDTMGVRRGHWRAIIAAGCLSPFALVIVAFLILPRAMAGLVLHLAIGLAGLGPASFTVDEAGWHALTLKQVEVGRARQVVASRVAVHFGKLGLLSGIHDGVVDGLHIRAGMENGAGRTPGPSPRIPAIRIPFPLRLNDFSAEFVTAAYVLRANGMGTVLVHDGIAGSLALALDPIGPGFAPHAGSLVFGDGKAAPLMQLHFVPGDGPGARFGLDVTMTPAPGGTALHVALRDGALFGLIIQSLDLNGVINSAGGFTSLSLSQCGSLKGWRIETRHFVLDKASLCAQGQPVLQVSSDDVKLALSVADAAIRTDSFAGTLPVFGFTMNGDTDFHHIEAQLKAEGGALQGPGRLGLSDIALHAEVDAKDLRLTRAQFALQRAVLAGTGTKPWLAPITLVGHGETVDGQFRFSLEGTGGGYDKLLHADGVAALGGESGQAEFATMPLDFAKPGHAPDMVFPVLGDQAGEAKGILSAEGRYSWDSRGARSEGTAHLENLALRLPQGKVEGLSGTIAFSGLAPLMTASPQSLRVAHLDIGLPLTDGFLRFVVDPSGQARILEAHLAWLGGTVGISAATLSFAGKTQSLTFAIDQVDLAQLLDLAKVNGLSGTGRISGRIPVIIEGGHQTVSAGELHADPPGGTIAYKTGQARANPSNPSGLLYTALDDFHYESMTGELTGDLAGELSLRVHLKGRNPSLYDGRRIELNVSTAGPFIDMVRKGLYGYRQP